MPSLQIWEIFASGFVGGFGSAVCVYSYFRDRRNELYTKEDCEKMCEIAIAGHVRATQIKGEKQ